MAQHYSSNLRARSSRLWAMTGSVPVKRASAGNCRAPNCVAAFRPRARVWSDLEFTSLLGAHMSKDKMGGLYEELCAETRRVLPAVERTLSQIKERRARGDRLCAE